ncbi:MAG: putative Ig domain-containing protein [Acidimicrobiales bacterium]
MVTTCSTSATPVITAAGLPSGVVLTDHRDGTATIAGVPTGSDAGVHEVTLTVTVTGQSPGVQQFALTVDSAPSFSSAQSATAVVGSAFTFTVTTIDGYPTPVLAVSKLPTGLTFSDEHDGTATLSGTPAKGTAGTHQLRLSATNGVGPPVVQDFTLVIVR